MWLFSVLIGVIAGSVANAIIYRLPRGISWYKGRSFCPNCKHHLSSWDLVPVLSYLFLRGHCRYCHSPIAKRYLIVELLMGLGFVLIFNFLPHSGTIFNLLIYWITFVIAVMDWETMLVSDWLVLIWMVIVILHKFSIYNLQFLINFSIFNFQNPLFHLFIGSFVIGSIWLFSKGKAMGSGDIGIAAVLGLWLGFPKIINALWLAFVIGGIYGAYLLLTRKAKLKTAVPFGPFLILGGWIAYTLNYGIF